jgi:hypothetical protein
MKEVRADHRRQLDSVPRGAGDDGPHDERTDVHLPGPGAAVSGDCRQPGRTDLAARTVRGCRADIDGNCAGLHVQPRVAQHWYAATRASGLAQVMGKFGLTLPEIRGFLAPIGSRRWDASVPECRIQPY